MTGGLEAAPPQNRHFDRGGEISRWSQVANRSANRRLLVAELDHLVDQPVATGSREYEMEHVRARPARAWVEKDDERAGAINPEAPHIRHGDEGLAHIRGHRRRR